MTGSSSATPRGSAAAGAGYYVIDIEALGRNNLRRLLPERPARDGWRADPSVPAAADDPGTDPAPATPRPPAPA